MSLTPKEQFLADPVQENSATAGSIVSFNTNGKMPIKKYTLEIAPIQEGSGDPSPENVRPIRGLTAVHVWLAPERPKIYGVRWDGASAQMTRYGDAGNITGDTSNFSIKGSVSASYDNPFDQIYPWSERKLCNINLANYMALRSDNELRDCITKTETDDGFNYYDDDGVWVYTPQFWGRSYADENGNYCYEVSDKPQKGFLYYPEMITARWRGTVEQRTIDGSSKNVLLSKPGMPGKNVAMSTLHSYAKNYGGSVTTIYSIDVSYLLMIVEYASFVCRERIGGGVNNVYRQNNDHFTADTTNGAVVQVAKTYTILPDSIFDIGTSNGGAQIGSYSVISVNNSGSEQAVTLDRAVTVTTEHFWSVHGMINTKDETIGGKSGYLGPNNQSHAYYRGEELWGNLWMYCLGAYKQANTNLVYLCPLNLDPDNYSAIDANVHVNTGIALCDSNGYQKMITAPRNRETNLSAAIFTTEVGSPANASGPIGAYYYVDTTNNRIPIVGGGAADGSYVGLSWYWYFTAGRSAWYFGASPRLKSPKGVVRGSALPMTA